MKRHTKILVFYVAIPALVVGLAALVGLVALVEVELRRACAVACQENPGDPVDALIAVACSEDNSLRERNRAIWALGQLRDARALAVLETLATGGPCAHDEYVCQYELGKAIRACKGGTPNPFFWRRAYAAR